MTASGPCAARHERRQAAGASLPLAFRKPGFVDGSHSAIDGPAQGQIINQTDRRAENSRTAQLDLLAALGPDGITREYAALLLSQKSGSARAPKTPPTTN